MQILNVCKLHIHACLCTCIQIQHTGRYHVLYWRDNGGHLDDIQGLAVLKFRKLCESYLLHFYTGINVGLYFAGSFPSTFIVYRRTHIKTFEDDMR